MDASKLLDVERDYWLFLNNPDILDPERKKLFEKLDKCTTAELIKYKPAHPEECVIIYYKRNLPEEWAKVETLCKQLKLQHLKPNEL